MQRKIVMTMPVAEFNPLHIVGGSVIRNCESCQQQVYVSPTTILAKQQDQEIELLCLPCAKRAIEAEKEPAEFELIPGQAEELRKEIADGPSVRN